MSGWGRRALAAAVATALALPASPAGGADAGAVDALLRDLKSPQFEQASRAAQALGGYPGDRARTVPALIEAIERRDWNRCAADVRDAIARTLGRLGAREAVEPLLGVVRRGTPIEHECLE